MTQRVKFNVGGQKYEVSTTLLAMYPNTILAKSASDQWQEEDPETEIFLECDGALFRHLLNYIRDDGKVYLPFTVPKEALIDELS